MILCIFLFIIHIKSMRTNIVIDDDLMANALKATGLKTKRDVVEQGLKLIVLRQNQQAIRGLRGKIKWEGSLDEMRANNDIS